PAPSHSPRFPYTTLFRSELACEVHDAALRGRVARFGDLPHAHQPPDRRHVHDRATAALHHHGRRAAGQLERRDEIELERGAEVRSEEHTSELQSPYDLVC